MRAAAQLFQGLLGGVLPPGNLPGKLVHRLHLVQPGAAQGHMAHLGEIFLLLVAGGGEQAAAQHKGAAGFHPVGPGDPLHRLIHPEDLGSALQQDDAGIDGDLQRFAAILFHTFLPGAPPAPKQNPMIGEDAKHRVIFRCYSITPGGACQTGLRQPWQGRRGG